MIKQILAFFLFLFCIVGHSCEKEPLLPDVMTGFERALAAKTYVWVMVVREGARYTASYDVSEETMAEEYVPACGEKIQIILPVMYFLKNDALKGYEKRRFCPQQTDFSKELECVGGAVERWRYKRCDFFSLGLRSFLTLFAPKIEQKGKVCWDECGQHMTGGILQRFAPPEGQFLRFVIQDVRDAVAEVRAAKEGDPIKVFMTLPGFGVVKGVPASASEELTEVRLSEKCFLRHKMSSGFLDTMRVRYSYDAYKWKRCLNYDGGVKGCRVL